MLLRIRCAREIRTANVINDLLTDKLVAQSTDLSLITSLLESLWWVAPEVLGKTVDIGANDVHDFDLGE